MKRVILALSGRQAVRETAVVKELLQGIYMDVNIMDYYTDIVIRKMNISN